jgi:hypothetical protein
MAGKGGYSYAQLQNVIDGLGLPSDLHNGKDPYALTPEQIANMKLGAQVAAA